MLRWTLLPESILNWRKIFIGDEKIVKNLWKYSFYFMHVKNLVIICIHFVNIWICNIFYTFCKSKKLSFSSFQNLSLRKYRLSFSNYATIKFQLKKHRFYSTIYHIAIEMYRSDANTQNNCSPSAVQSKKSICTAICQFRKPRVSLFIIIHK